MIKVFHQRIKPYYKSVIKAGQLFGENDLIQRSAALSYYTIFSLPPILLILMQTTSVFYNTKTIQETIFGKLSEWIGQSTAEQLTETVETIGLFEREGWALVVGIGATLFTATTIFAAIQGSLNKIFSVDGSEERMAWWAFIRTRLISLALLLSIAFVLIVSLTINALINRFIDFLQEFAPGISYLIIIALSILLPLLIITLLFALIFMVLPDKKIPWKVARTGGIITAVLFFIGKYGISLYIGLTNTGNLYEAAGYLMVVMVWVFYASAIFYFGAQFTAVYHNNHFASG